MGRWACSRRRPSIDEFITLGITLEQRAASVILPPGMGSSA
jgi:hypothetical protein